MSTAALLTAARAGSLDGAIRALVRPDDFDPTGGFCRRVELSEDDRAAYVKAYEIGFRKAIGGGR